jgi:uncharacterized protein with von Willebrand factor type A (vWA) domain
MANQNDESLTGGIIHTYRGYDPQRFPMPASEPPDLVTPAFEHMLAYGSMRDLTPEQLAEAIELDPSQIRGLGPSISSLLAMLEERKRRILETYETESVRKAADQTFKDKAGNIHPPVKKRERFEKAVRNEQIADLEKIWYGEDEQSDFAKQILGLMENLGNKYEVETLAAKYAFTGRTGMNIPQAIEIKEELETIDKLIQQLKDAAKNAKIYLIDLNELARFAEEEQVDEMREMQRQVEEMLEQIAAEQGLQQDGNKFTLTPKAFKIFQSKLLDQIFSDLQAAKSGRHQVEITGDGAVELQRTKPYEFGDSLANMDVPSSLINAMIRESTAAHVVAGAPAGRGRAPKGIRLKTEDIEIHRTRNTPKCATVVCMDMSGSMRWDGAYVNVKRMALALHGLIRTEYPGDFIDFVEVFSLCKRRHISEIPQLMPKPVTIHEPWVRLKADMSDDKISERDIPPHFTNLQHGLRMARQILQGQDTPNRQVILITDGLPTAHYEDKMLYLLYPPDKRTEHFTMREAAQCQQQGITINIFLLSNWSQSQEDIQFANRMAERTKGRVVYVSGTNLDRFVLWDYLHRRRMIIG